MIYLTDEYAKAAQEFEEADATSREELGIELEPIPEEENFDLYIILSMAIREKKIQKIYNSDE